MHKALSEFRRKISKWIQPTLPQKQQRWAAMAQHGRSFYSPLLVTWQILFDSLSTLIWNTELIQKNMFWTIMAQKERWSTWGQTDGQCKNVILGLLRHFWRRIKCLFSKPVSQMCFADVDQTPFSQKYRMPSVPWSFLHILSEHFCWFDVKTIAPSSAESLWIYLPTNASKFILLIVLDGNEQIIASNQSSRKKY